MIAVYYTLFAALATVVNITFQELTMKVYSEQFSLELALAVGTLVGLVVKYYLDKKYIFKAKTTTHAETARQFYLYAGFGLVTTAIFWGLEIGFDWYTDGNKVAVYSAGAFGLAIGYWVKYHLDKKYVFSD